jgi:hypothetical protein
VTAARKSPLASMRAASRRTASRRTAGERKSPVGFIESMECLPVSTIPEGEGWTYEIKLYGLATGVWTWNFAGKTCDDKCTPHVHG